ncbi:hypothetical protein GCM10027265_13200 [Jatrophihabitans fulvus]
MLALAAVIVLWLAYLIAVPLFAWSDVGRVDAEPEGNRPSETPGTTYLLVGSDSRKGLSREQDKQYGTGGVGDVGARTDSILMLHVPDGDGPNLLLSIPRDSQVNIPGHGTQKINAAFAIGGPKLLVRTIEQDTGVRIDDYVEIGFAGFVDIIDAVNGITICPKQAIKDKKANLNIKAGCQDADGPTALGYARSRYGQQQGDIDRALHQREVVAATAGEVVSPSTFLLPWRYWSVWFAGAESLRVGDNVGLWDMQRFARAMRGGNSKQCVVPIINLAVTWDPVKAPRLFKQIREDDTSAIRCTARLGS